MFHSGVKHDHQFVSPKVRAPIPIGHPLVHAALVQASLDPAARSIEYVRSAAPFGAAVALNAIVVVSDDGRFALDIQEARPLRDIDEEGLVLLALAELGLTLLVLSAVDICAEPRHSNCRLVWSYRNTRVGVGLRVQILQAVIDEGPMALGRLMAAIRSDRDPGPAILALACADLLELDLAASPLGPHTIVRSRT